MAPIRQGDGTGVAPKGIKEVRTRAGDVVYSAGGTAIPDSGDLQARYDATQLSLNDGDSVSTWGDETGNGYDLTAGTAPIYKTSVINGNPVVRFDGVDDFLDVAWSALSQPNHIFVVFKYQSVDTGSNETVTDGAASRHSVGHGGVGLNGAWNIFAGNSVNDGSTTADTNAHIQTGLFNTTSSENRLDGTTLATGDVGSDNLDGFRVGSDSTGAGFSPVGVGEILVYPQDKSSVQSDIESYLSDKWGIAI